LYNYHVFENNNLIEKFSLLTFEDFKNASDATLKHKPKGKYLRD
jgi:hypothetical protein